MELDLQSLFGLHVLQLYSLAETPQHRTHLGSHTRAPLVSQDDDISLWPPDHREVRFASFRFRVGRFLYRGTIRLWHVQCTLYQSRVHPTYIHINIFTDTPPPFSTVGQPYLPSRRLKEGGGGVSTLWQNPRSRWSLQQKPRVVDVIWQFPSSLQMFTGTKCIFRTQNIEFNWFRLNVVTLLIEFVLLSLSLQTENIQHFKVKRERTVR